MRVVGAGVGLGEGQGGHLSQPDRHPFRTIVSRSCWKVEVGLCERYDDPAGTMRWGNPWESRVATTA